MKEKEDLKETVDTVDESGVFTVYDMLGDRIDDTDPEKSERALKEYVDAALGGEFTEGAVMVRKKDGEFRAFRFVFDKNTVTYLVVDMLPFMRINAMPGNPGEGGCDDGR